MARKSSLPSQEEAQALLNQPPIDDDEAASSPEAEDSLAELAPDEADPAFPAVSVVDGPDGAFPGEARADAPAPQEPMRPAPPPPPTTEEDAFEAQAAPYRGSTERVLVAKFGGVPASRCVRLPFSAARAKMPDIYEEITNKDGSKSYVVPKERMI